MARALILAGGGIPVMILGWFWVRSMAGRSLHARFDLDIDRSIMTAAFIVLSLPGVFLADVAQVRSTATEALSVVSVLQAILLVALAVAVVPGTLATMALRRTGLFTVGPVASYALFIVVALGSVAYSPLPFHTFAKAGFTALFFAVLLHFALRIVQLPATQRAAYIGTLWDHFLWLTVGFLAVVWLSTLYDPAAAFTGLAGEDRLYGSWFHWSPNLLGQLGGTVAVVFGFRLSRSDKPNRVPQAAACILGVVTLMAAWSRASIFASALAVGLMAIRERRNILVLATLAIGSTAVLVAGTELAGYILRGQSVEAFGNATGRLPTWQFSTILILESPITGHGYYVGPGLVAERFNLSLSNLDNTFVEVAVELGVLGLAPILAFFAFVLGPFVRVGRRDVPPYYTELFGAVIILGVRALSGPTFHEADFNLILALIIGLAGWSQRRVVHSRSTVSMSTPAAAHY